mmetsp:Transcript_971/g.1877  ORF Transcript_971/g.1877 Transcript_971/m.1877 type:complete len:144 (-) Transcript_971:116-547(-)
MDSGSGDVKKTVVRKKEKKRPVSWQTNPNRQRTESPVTTTTSTTNTPRKSKGLLFMTPRGARPDSKNASWIGQRSTRSLASTPKTKNSKGSDSLITEESTPTFKRDCSVRMSPKVQRTLESMVVHELTVKNVEPIVVEDAWFT